MIVDPSISQPQPLPTMGVRSANDIVDHLDKVLAAQPPEVKAAVDHAHGVLGLQSPSTIAANGPESPLAAPTPPVSPEASITASGSAGGISPIVSAGSPTDAQPLPTPKMAAPDPVHDDSDPIVPAATAKATTPIIANPHMQNLERMTAEGPGTNKIHNPFLRGLATVGDAIGSGLFPEFARYIPGTTAHHYQLLGEEEGQLGQEQKAEKSAADVAHTGAQAGLENAQAGAIPSEIDLRGAQANEADVRAENLLNPQGTVKDEELLYDKNGTPIGYRDKGGKYYGPEDPNLPPGVHDVLAAAKPKFAPENVHVLPDGTVVAIHPDKDGKPVSEIVYHGSPKVETEVAKLEVGGKPHTVLVNKKDGSTIKDLGETGEKPPTVNVTAETHQEEMKGKELLDKAEGAYRGAVQSAGSLGDFVNAAKSGNKVAAEAIPLEGALNITTAQGVHRINRNEIDQVAGAGNLFDRIMGRVGKITAGQPIPPDVLKDFADLATILQKGAYKTYKDAHSSAVKRYGLKGEEPLPEPGGGNNAPAVGTVKGGYTFKGGDPSDQKNWQKVTP